jgi:ArsR family transcriptional regulator, arsenate/arsenite/antimonite-responsive transcriptional repressor
MLINNQQERLEAQRRYSAARIKDFDLEQDEVLLRFGRAFADPMRIRILALLTTPTISHHISLLKRVGLINVRRENSYRHYELNPDGLQTIIENLTVEHLRSLDPSLTAEEDQ